MATAFRVLVVANKIWECEPLVAALLARDARPAIFDKFLRGYDPAESPVELDPETNAKPAPPPEADGLPMTGKLPIRPRLQFSVGVDAQVEVWCIEDWMRTERRKPGTTANVKASSSSSFEKFTYTLPRIKERAFKALPPNMVIAFGTAAIPVDEPLNGCVSVGSRVYLHDPWRDAPEDEIKKQVDAWGPLLRDEVPLFTKDALLSPRLKPMLFSKDISTDARHAAEARFVSPPIAPASPPRILAGHGFASLGTLNICDYDDYVWADEETLRLFSSQVRQREIGSMETTHGLIRLTWKDTPFLFVSGLVNRTLRFNVETAPRRYAQNMVAAHNAAVALAYMLPELARLNAKNELFENVEAATR